LGDGNGIGPVKLLLQILSAVSFLGMLILGFFLQKSIIVLKKIQFFSSIIEFGHRYLAMPQAIM